MSFAKQTLTVVTGASGAQLIQLLATPWLARTFAPSAFGEFAVFQSVLLVLVTISCLRYEMAIPVEKEPSQVSLLCILSVISLVGICFLAVAATLAIHF